MVPQRTALVWMGYTSKPGGTPSKLCNPYALYALAAPLAPIDDRFDLDPACLERVPRVPSRESLEPKGEKLEPEPRGGELVPEELPHLKKPDREPLGSRAGKKPERDTCILGSCGGELMPISDLRRDGICKGGPADEADERGMALGAFSGAGDGCPLSEVGFGTLNTNALS
mmetsp:Transcript_14990/g.24058  ORF Transcript_14990/g.24058 Transcript_14990/m.24058 type:complete len:171 (-) Transcript_14990:102-614(-)